MGTSIQELNDKCITQANGNPKKALQLFMDAMYKEVLEFIFKFCRIGKFIIMLWRRTIGDTKESIMSKPKQLGHYVCINNGLLISDQWTSKKHKKAKTFQLDYTMQSYFLNVIGFGKKTAFDIYEIVLKKSK